MGDVARHLLRRGLQRGIDFSYSDDFLLDHGFTVPLGFLRPEQDLPVVPIFTNVMAPPVATGRRFYDLGAAVVEMIEAHPASLRVAIIASGHLSNAIGGPAMARFLTEPESAWDRRVWEQITGGETESLLEETTYETLAAIGSGTPGFLDYLFALSAVPDFAGRSPVPSAPGRLPGLGQTRGLPHPGGGDPVSRYATNRVLWEVAADRDLTDKERAALARTDIRELFQLGVHPFLLYNFALRLNGGFSMEWMTSYLEQLRGLEVADLET